MCQPKGRSSRANASPACKRVGGGGGLDRAAEPPPTPNTLKSVKRAHNLSVSGKK